VDLAARVAKCIGEAFESGESTSLALCDLSRAFDSVSHTILARKLEFYGLKGPAPSLMKSYLWDRKQCVSIDGAVSGPLPVASGVPQGTTWMRMDRP
jgi:hypothetical protein